jgi:hypothetical protein
MVANQASNAARTPGLDAANRRDITQFSRQRAKTHSPTRATWIAGKPKCSWAGTDNEPGGIAPACRLGGNFGSPQPIDGGSALESRLNSGQLNRVSFVFGQPDRNVVTALQYRSRVPSPDQNSTQGRGRNEDFSSPPHRSRRALLTHRAPPSGQTSCDERFSHVRRPTRSHYSDRRGVSAQCPNRGRLTAVPLG